MGTFTRLILEANYEATLSAAVLNKARYGSNMRYLTMIGSVAFGTQLEWIINAIRRVLRLHKHRGLDARMASPRSRNPMLDLLTRRFQVIANHAPALLHKGWLPRFILKFATSLKIHHQRF